MTAALELSTNQVTHFYSKKKNTDEMIKLLDILKAEYRHLDRIFLSWNLIWTKSGTSATTRERTVPKCNRGSFQWNVTRCYP